MKKISFLSLFFVVMAATVVWAQDAPKQSRNLVFYTDYSSGHLVPGIVTANGVTERTNGLFSGHEMEFGIRYSQNFKNAPRISMGGTVLAVTKNNNNYDANLNFVGFNGYALDNIRANVWVAVPYFTILFDTRGLVGAYLNYRKSFGAAGTVSVGTDLEIFYTGDPFYNLNNFPNSSNKSRIVVDYFGMWLGYSVALGKGFSYATGLQFRFTSGTWGGVENDPVAAFNIRWNNTFSYANDGWNFYVTLRTEGFNIARSSTFNRDPNGRFRIITGVSYSFDLAIAK